MKYLIYILFFIPIIMQAQAPEGINYQALIRDASGVVVANQNVGIQIFLLQGSASGGAVYKETFSLTTNDFGLVNLQIGAGTPTLGNFSSIDWSNGTYFIETAVDVSGGTSYVVISTTQFMSVPYALYAKNSGLDSIGIQGIIDANPDFDADTTNELQTLSYINDTLSISGGNHVHIISGKNYFYNEFFDISTTWICPLNIDKVFVELWGAGGGGGGGSGGIQLCMQQQNWWNGGYSLSGAAGGSGGLGGYNSLEINVNPGNTYQITIGSGGIGGIAEVCGTGGNGNNGGSSSFSNLLSASGGFGGSGQLGTNGGVNNECISCIGTDGNVTNWRYPNYNINFPSYIPLEISGPVPSFAPGGTFGFGGNGTHSGVYSQPTNGGDGSNGFCIIHY
jgi:hypothetical protein